MGRKVGLSSPLPLCCLPCVKAGVKVGSQMGLVRRVIGAALPTVSQTTWRMRWALGIHAGTLDGLENQKTDAGIMELEGFMLGTVMGTLKI